MVQGRTLLFSIIHDITARKQAEAALRESEEKYHALVEQSLDGIMISDEHGNIVVWNKSMESITGIQQCDTIGRPLWEVQSRLIPGEQKTPELLEQLQNGLKNLLESKMDWSGEMREQVITCVDGTHKVLQDSSFMIKTDNHRKIGAILRDITGRKQMEMALRVSEERHRTIIQTTMEGFWMMDTSGQFTDVNETYCRMAGYPRADFLKLRIPDIDAGEESAETAERLRRIITHGSEIFEARHRRQDGSVFDVEISATYLDVDSGQWWQMDERGEFRE